MSNQSGNSTRGAAASTLAIGFVILAAGHVLLYLALTAGARSSIAAVTSKHEPAHLEHAKDPGMPPQPGGEAYSAWLRSYETWWASKDYALHGRHETLVKTGMLLSFLIGLGLLGHGMLRVSRSYAGPERRRHMAPIRQADRRAPLRVPTRRPVRVAPQRPAVRPAAVRPVAVRPVAVRRAAAAPVAAPRRRSA